MDGGGVHSCGFAGEKLRRSRWERAGGEHKHVWEDNGWRCVWD